MEIDPDKLEKLFSERYEKLEGLAPVVGAKRPLSNPAYEHWIDYCDEHGVVILHPEWLRETINEGIGDRICIHSPEDSGIVWLLVPREFAEKSLALGGLP